MPARRRGALGLFAVAWLSLAISPCAIAMAGTGDCAHCPPADARPMAAHHDHHDHRAAAEPAAAPCATLDEACDDLDRASTDQRGSQAKAKVGPETFALPVNEWPGANAAREILPRVATGPPGGGRASPPLNLLYCVFLK